MQDISNFKMYSLQDIAKILGVTYRTVVNYKNAGKIKAVKIGNRWRISEDNLKEFLQGEEEAK